MGRFVIGLLALAAPLPALAQPVAVKVEWIGNDAVGGVLVGRVREAIAASPDKRSTSELGDGLAAIVQTLDPAVEWQDAAAAKSRITVYSLTINQHRSYSPDDTFAGAALGYCAQADLADCAREIVEAIDEQIAKRGLR